MYLVGGNSNVFLFSPRKLGKISNLTNIFQVGWHHQLDIYIYMYINIFAGWFLLIRENSIMHLNSPKKSNSLKTNVQLIEESLHSCTTWGVENLVSNGINYLSTQDSFHQPYLRSPTYFFPLNSLLSAGPVIHGYAWNWLWSQFLAGKRTSLKECPETLNPNSSTCSWQTCAGKLDKFSTWNAKCLIFLDNFTSKTSNYWLKK